jgi:hypothetical protein
MGTEPSMGIGTKVAGAKAGFAFGFDAIFDFLTKLRQCH